MTRYALLALLVVATVSFKFINLHRDPPKTVPYVELPKYLGKWYEQAVIPFYFERDCTMTTATYSLNTDGTIRVDNSCTRNGRKVESVGKAFPDPTDTTKSNAKLKVEFSSTLDIEGNYWIVRLGKFYEYSVVSTPSYTYMWILSREQVMSQALYDSIIADLKADQFPVEKLHRTPQQ